MTKRILSFSIIFFIVLTDGVGQNLFQNVVKIEVVDSNGNEEVGAGLVIGSKNKSIYVASVYHLFKNVEQEIWVKFKEDPVKSRHINHATIISKYDSLDLVFLEVDIKDRRIHFNNLLIADYRKIKHDTLEASCVGHPNSRETGWKKIKTNIKAPQFQDSLIHFVEYDPLAKTVGFSGGSVYYPRNGQVIGMVSKISETQTEISCLNMSLIHRIAKDDGRENIPTNYLKPAPYIPRRVQTLKYVGLSSLIVAGASRLVSDATYRNYRRDGKKIDAVEFEKTYGKTLDQMYDKANFFNRLSYVTGGVGLLALGTSILLYKDFNPEKEFQIPYLFIGRIGANNDQITVGYRFTF